MHSSMTDWVEEASRVIKAFDAALGRPPFPVTASVDLVCKAQAVQETLAAVAAAGKLKCLEGVNEVTTTLPILCASLKEGSPNQTPCLQLYCPLLLAAAQASALSTYPISYLLRDAEQVLGPQAFSSATSTSVTCNLTSASTAAPRDVDSGEAKVEKEVTLFTFMALTHTLTPAYMRRFLRLEALEPCSSGHDSNRRGRKSKAGTAHAKAPDNKVQPFSPCSTTSDIHRGGEAVGSSSAVPRALLHSIIEAPLSDACRAVFESFVDNTPKFLACVDRDGDLARRILDVYAGHIIPKLKPSSLLRCLDASLLDYYVDVVAASLRAGHVTLLSSRELRSIAVEAWDDACLSQLGCAAVSRRIGDEDAMASLLVYVFLYLVYCNKSTNECLTTPPPSPQGHGERGPRLSVTEAHLIAAVSKASKAVFLTDRASSLGAFASLSCVQSKSGVLSVQGSAVSLALEPLRVFGDLLLARPAAVSLWHGGLAHQVEWGAQDATLTMAEVRASASLLEANVVGVIEGVLRSAPRPDQDVRPSSKRGQESTKCAVANLKRKQKSSNGRSGKVSHTHAASIPPTEGQPTDAEEAVPVSTPLSELLSGCCSCLLLTQLMHTGAGTSRDDARMSEDDACYQNGHLVDCVVRAYHYLLQHQSQRLSAGLWRNFSILMCFTWKRGMEALCRSTEDGDMAYLQSTKMLLSAPSTITVLTALTQDTDSMLWLSPLLVLSYSSLPSTSNAASEMLSQVLWGSPYRALWMAVVRAAANGEMVEAGTNTVGQAPNTSSLLEQQLHPIPAAFLLGMLCNQWSSAVLADVGECVAATTTGGGEGKALVATLIRMRTSDACTGKVALPRTYGLAVEFSPSSLPQHGLQRLLDEVGRLQAKYLSASISARQEADEEDRQRMQAQLQSIHALSESHRCFCEAAEAKRAAKMAEQQRVQEELQRRRAERVARLHEDAAALDRKRLMALETRRRQAMLSRAEAEAARQRRFDSYRRRLESEYRVSTFLEHLQLSSARVMEVREALRSVMENITPDDLLEYLVTGKAKVPTDMLDKDDVDAADKDEASDADDDHSAGAIPQCAAEHQASGPTPPRPPATGERRDFWAEVMDGAWAKAESASPYDEESSYHRIGDGSPEPTTATVSNTVAPKLHNRSFHARIAPLMDLFCYDDGDEFGRVPEVLPMLDLRTVSRVWLTPQVQSLGFTDVRDAFQHMREHGLVRIHDDTAQLTLLGFRYHFPFHNPEGTLEIHLCKARERVRALVAAQKDSPNDTSASEGDDDVDGEAEEGDEDCETSAHLSMDRLLPDVEFGV